MNTYVAIINGKSVLAFRAEDDDEARAIIEDEGGSMRSDLRALAGMDGKSLWDGKSAIEVREATAAQHAEWKQSRDQAIRDGEIDLDDLHAEVAVVEEGIFQPPVENQGIGRVVQNEDLTATLCGALVGGPWIFANHSEVSLEMNHR